MNDYISADELHEHVSQQLAKEAPSMTPQFFPVREGHKIRLVKSPKLKGDPELEYRQEAERLCRQGKFSNTAKNLLGSKRERLGLSIEQAETIEAAVKKPWQERERKLQKYEENLVEELKEHNPLPDWLLTELDEYRQELGLRPEDVEAVHQKFDVPVIPIVIETLPSLIETSEFLQVSELASEKGIDYTRLRDLLVAEKWRAADQETYWVMLRAVGKEEEYYFTSDELLNFPCTDLKTIDSLWVKCSEGHFGFSVQKQIYVECGAKLDGKYPGNEIWYEFCKRVGWRTQGGYVDYDDLNANPSNFLKGEFPCCVGLGKQVMFSSLLSHRDL